MPMVFKCSMRAVSGSLASEVRGKHGLGYDAIVVPGGGDRTFAEMTREEKERDLWPGRDADLIIPPAG
jgi:inosine/xanthosine triphosphate pyrophosphatase family protein